MSMFPPYFGSSYWLGTLGAAVKANPVEPDAAAEIGKPLERINSIASGFGQFPDYCSDMPPATLGTYKMFRCLPIVIFAYGLVTDPILAGTRTLIIRDDEGNAAPKRKLIPTGNSVQVMAGPEDKRKKRDEDVYEGHWADILLNLEAVNFGFGLMEVEWDRLPQGVTGPKRFKPFLPWDVQLLKDKYNDFAGFKFGNEERDARYAFHFVHGRQFDPLFGWPRLADCIHSCHRLRKSQSNTDRLEAKAAGIQMAIGIMDGMTFKDATGAVMTTKQIVESVMNAAVQGKTWTYPLQAYSIDTVRGNPELAKVKAMEVQEFDWGDSGPAILASISRRAELKVEVVNGYRRPEREGMEGQHGTKAEAGVHGEVGIRDSEGLAGDFYRQFNKGHYNRYLVTNDGPDAADSMYWQPAPLADPQQTFKQEMVAAMLANPASAPLAEAMIDLYALMKSTELPLVPQDQVPKIPPMPAADPNAPQGQNGGGGPAGGRMGQMAGANGNGNGN